MGKIGFIGLGIMGRPMAKNLIEAGYELVVYDVVGAARWGIRCLGFDFCGFAPKGELEEAGAVAVVHTAAEIVRFILERQ